jgi:AraC family transcriptional regulator of adaptative response/methylated-DNA-[protein]-cysteine methyltransferase
MPKLPPDEELQRAFLDRDASYDGVFYAAVTTTGIFCRPSCPARKAKPENLKYYATAAEALFAGYRPCLRCKPLESSSDPAWMAELVAKVEAEPGTRIQEAELRALGLDPATVRRRFQSRYGLSFSAYQRARRLASAFEAIREGGSLDDAVFDHGYESHSGFREAFARLFGEAPGKAGAREGADFIRIGCICLLESSDRRMLEAQGKILAARLGLPIAPGRHPLLDRLERELDEYFSGKRPEFSLPIDEPGTEFQEKVWSALRTIPRGQSWSYARLAEAIGQPKAVRAVARANGMNRVAILVPCHRVIGADGGLGGYSGGIWRKERLLEIEGARGPGGKDNR